MNETDGRLAPVVYLPGVQPPSVSPALDPAGRVTPDGVQPAGRAVPEGPASRPSDWNTSWAVHDDVDDEDDDEYDSSCADLIDEAAARATDASPAELAATAERISLTALTRRGMSQRELERVLRDRGLDDATIATELDRLVRVGLIDDLALAQTLVGRLQERKGLGRTAIAAELTRRLLAPSAIEYALELVDSGDELARAKELAVKRAAQLRSLDREAAVRRLSGYLMRRGYSGSTVRAAVDQALPMRATAGRGTVRFR